VSNPYRSPAQRPKASKSLLTEIRGKTEGAPIAYHVRNEIRKKKTKNENQNIKENTKIDNAQAIHI
jgi:hypothetical protein